MNSPKKQRYSELILFTGFLGVLCFILFPTYTDCGGRSRWLIPVSKVKQLGTSLYIYTTDYDDRYPATSAMPGLRAAVMPYVKNRQLFDKEQGLNTEPIFNFNLAGVSADLPPYPGTAEPGIAEVGVWHTQIFGEKPGASIGFADTSARFFAPKDFGKVATALSFQFDRKGVKLFPPDYLEDQDPLKENK